MTTQHFILATAGHVDHGKSALVKALTGTDPDRLPEEKARGITIDLGFAHLTLAAPSATDGGFDVGIIDVPGHEDFVKNMVAGVGSIDLALIVVATDDGWMPQTEEHVQILTYLGVERAVVALTKVDLGNADAAAQAIRERLGGTPYANAAIVKTSCLTGEGIDALRTELARAFQSAKSPRDNAKPRLPVDRAFALHGIGTIVTGTLTGGKFERGAAVVVQPGKIAARVRMIQSHNEELSTALPGTRTALNISDVPIARRRGERGVWRGNVVTLAELGEPGMIVDVLISRSARLPAKSPPIKHGSLVRGHHGSGNFPARIFFQNGKAVPPGGVQIAQLRFESPVFLFVGDRFVVRDSSEQRTVAGGVVLDVDTSVRRFRSDPQRKLLSARAEAAGEVKTFVGSEVVRDRLVRRESLLVKSCFAAAEIAAALDGLAANGTATVLGDFVADTAYWKALRGAAMAAVDAEHQAHPHVAGLDLGALRSRLKSELPFPDAFDSLVDDLCRNGFARVGGAIKRGTHHPTLPPQLQSAGVKLRAALSTKPFDPPSRRELLPDSAAHQALRFLRDIGEVVEIGSEVVLNAEALARMRTAVADFLRTHGPASAGELRQMLGTSRRIVIPFLEQCDRDGITRRVGDQRILPP